MTIEERKEKDRIRKKNERDNLSDSYIRSLFKRQSFSLDDPPPTLIKLKKMHLACQRVIWAMKKGEHDKAKKIYKAVDKIKKEL